MPTAPGLQIAVVQIDRLAAPIRRHLSYFRWERRINSCPSFNDELSMYEVKPMKRFWQTCTVLLLATSICRAQVVGSELSERTNEADVLSDAQWEEVNEAVNHSLEWIASQQQRDGSFPTMPHAQPGVTSLCVLAFMAHGHVPGEGEYGVRLERAIDYIVGCQKRNGLLALVAPNGDRLSRNIDHEIGYTVAYNHAIAGLALSESYAMNGSERAQQLEPVIKQAMDATLEMQNWPKDIAVDEGGWRYLDNYDDRDSDLSVTGWQLMFLRSAKNAGFDVPDEPIERAIGYVRRCFRRDVGHSRIRLGQKIACHVECREPGFWHSLMRAYTIRLKPSSPVSGYCGAASTSTGAMAE